MFIQAVKTKPFVPPQDDIFPRIKESFSGIDLKEESIIVIASKIVSIWQGRCVRMDLVKDKDELIKKEADLYLDRDKVPKGYVMLTVKDNILIPTAGIDESNADGYYILWPEKPFGAAKQIYDFFKENYNLKNFGIIIADSHCTPSRLGTMGISISYYGFYPLRDYRGTKDIFGREMKISQSNVADSLATAAVFAMGEGNEQTPIAIIRDINSVEFREFDPSYSNPLNIDRDEDVYAPLLKAIEWRKGGNR